MSSSPSLCKTRASQPSPSQQVKLTELLQDKKWLVTGYARTTSARKRTRAAWQEIANTLNTEDEGCSKSWQQWAKYWKDKKSALKRKLCQLQTLRQKNGAAADDIICLSDVDHLILNVIGGESKMLGEKAVENDPLHQRLNEKCAQETATTSDPNMVLLKSQPRESFHKENTSGDDDSNSSRSLQLSDNGSGTLSSHAPNANSTPRCSYLTARRRAQSSQRRPKLGRSLTERFLAVEERRVEIDMILAQNQKKTLQVLRTISEAWFKQSQALHELVSSLVHKNRTGHSNRAMKREDDDDDDEDE